MQSIKSDWSFKKEKAIINLLSSSGRCLLSFIRWYTKKQLEKGRNVNKWLQKEITLLDIKLLCLAKFYFIFLHDTLLSLHNSLKKLLLTSVLIAKWIVSFVYFLTWNSSAVDFTEYFKEKKLSLPLSLPYGCGTAWYEHDLEERLRQRSFLQASECQCLAWPVDFFIF